MKEKAKCYISRQISYHVAITGLRLIPFGRKKVFLDGKDIYGVFMSMFNETYSEFTYDDFKGVLKCVFPLYKNKRKHTETFKLSDYKIQHQMFKLGINNFPTNGVMGSELIKIKVH